MLKFVVLILFILSPLTGNADTTGPFEVTFSVKGETACIKMNLYLTSDNLVYGSNVGCKPPAANSLIYDTSVAGYYDKTNNSVVVSFYSDMTDYSKLYGLFFYRIGDVILFKIKLDTMKAAQVVEVSTSDVNKPDKDNRYGTGYSPMLSVWDVSIK